MKRDTRAQQFQVTTKLVDHKAFEQAKTLTIDSTKDVIGSSKLGKDAADIDVTKDEDAGAEEFGDGEIDHIDLGQVRFCT